MARKPKQPKCYVVYSYDQADEMDGGEVEFMHGVYLTRKAAKEAAFQLFRKLVLAGANMGDEGELEDDEDEVPSEDVMRKQQDFRTAEDCFGDDTLFVYFKPVPFYS